MTGISAQQKDWVDVTIAPDGKYDFGMYRTIGVFGGSGTMTLSDGKLQGRGDRGSSTFTLYQGGARRVLKVASHAFGRPSDLGRPHSEELKSPRSGRKLTCPEEPGRA